MHAAKLAQDAYAQTGGQGMSAQQDDAEMQAAFDRRVLAELLDNVKALPLWHIYGAVRKADVLALIDKSIGQMKYSKDERQHIANVFMEAKKYLCHDYGSGGYSYNMNIHASVCICYAIDNTASIALGGKLAAKRVIAERLNHYATVNEYLYYEVRVPEELLTPKNVQAFRHRWLDSLIVEFSK
jgi:hypothetical protein